MDRGYPTLSILVDERLEALVGRGGFAQAPKLPKKHIKHELDAHLSTPLVVTLPFLLWYLPSILYVTL